jgi:hypothetical protein
LLNNCEPLLNSYTERHNAVVNYIGLNVIKKDILKLPSPHLHIPQVLIDKAALLPGITKLRPDIIVNGAVEPIANFDKVLVLDVKVPAPHISQVGDFLSKKDEKNIKHYSE